MNELPEGPYKAYDVMTGEYLGGYAAMHLAYEAHPDKGLSVIYRPSKRKRTRRSFP